MQVLPSLFLLSVKQTELAPFFFVVQAHVTIVEYLLIVGVVGLERRLRPLLRAADERTFLSDAFVLLVQVRVVQYFLPHQVGHEAGVHAFEDLLSILIAFGKESEIELSRGSMQVLMVQHQLRISNDSICHCRFA